MTVWPVPFWQVLLTMVPFFVVYVVVVIFAFARVHKGKRVRIRLRRPKLGNVRDGLEWKIPGILIGGVWFVLITNFPTQLLGFFGINVNWFTLGVDFSKGPVCRPTRTSWGHIVIDALLYLAMVLAGALLAAWWHNRRLPETTAPEPTDPQPTDPEAPEAE
jgi:hypothetical protein